MNNEYINFLEQSIIDTKKGIENNKKTIKVFLISIIFLLLLLICMI